MLFAQKFIMLFAPMVLTQSPGLRKSRKIIYWQSFCLPELILLHEE